VGRGVGSQGRGGREVVVPFAFLRPRARAQPPVLEGVGGTDCFVGGFVSTCTFSLLFAMPLPSSARRILESILPEGDYPSEPETEENDVSRNAAFGRDLQMAFLATVMDTGPKGARKPSQRARAKMAAKTMDLRSLSVAVRRFFDHRSEFRELTTIRSAVERAFPSRAQRQVKAPNGHAQGTLKGHLPATLTIDRDGGVDVARTCVFFSEVVRSAIAYPTARPEWLCPDNIGGMDLDNTVRIDLTLDEEDDKEEEEDFRFQEVSYGDTFLTMGPRIVENYRDFMGSPEIYREARAKCRTWLKQSDDRKEAVSAVAETIRCWHHAPAGARRQGQQCMLSLGAELQQPEPLVSSTQDLPLRP
jgi:hypothetical protein